MGSSKGVLHHLWLSPWTGWIGFRYLKSKKHSRFLSFITTISIVGVALGVTAMIIVLSIMDGFEAELKKRLMTTDLHVLISPTPEIPEFHQGLVVRGSPKARELEERLKSDPSVEAAYPVIATEVILRSGKKVTGAVVKGVDEARLGKLQQQVTESALPQLLVEHDGPETIRLPGLYVGQELAYELQLVPGAAVTLISPMETEGPLNSVPRMKKFVVEGIYRSGAPEQELHTLFAREGSVRSFLRKADVVSQWEVTVRNFDDAPAVASRIRAEAPGFRVEDWIQLNAQLFFSLKLERWAMFLILAIIVVVASFNIITTLTLMVLEKKREISILKAMGARNGQVAAIFLSEGLFIGAIGVGSGVLIGWIACVLLKRYQLIELPDIYYDRSLPVTFEPLYYLGVAIVALLIVLAACVYPSKRASRVDPLEGIRFG